MALEKRVFGYTDGWPFKHMEVGDVVICTRPKAAQTAHAYGAVVHKRFTTTSRQIDDGWGGTLTAVKVKRMPDDWVKPREEYKAVKAAHAKEKARRQSEQEALRERKLMHPWEHIGYGTCWESPPYEDDENGVEHLEITNIRRRAMASNRRLTTQYKHLAAVQMRPDEAEVCTVSLREFSTSVKKLDGGRRVITVFRGRMEPVVRLKPAWADRIYEGDSRHPQWIELRMTNQLHPPVWGR